MLTRCPECQQEVSTAATQCPHCGAPLSQGAKSAAPMAQPVSAGPGYGQAAPPPQPQSHCLRNCLIVGCLLVVLVVGGFFAVSAMFVSKMKNSFTTDSNKIATIGNSVAPGATTPKGYEEKFGIDLSWFSFKAKGAILMKGGDPNQGGTLIGYGALAGKQSNEQFKESFQKALQNAGGQGGGGHKQQVEKSEEVELDVGGTPAKALHMITVDQQTGKKSSMYVLVLDDWPNEFGWLGVGAMGPEDKFDLDGFKAFLASLKKK